MIFLLGIMAILAVVLVFGIYLLFRNNAVYKEGMRVLNIIDKAAREDAAAGREWEWRYEEFSSISYHQALWKFWKPVGSFYKHITERQSQMGKH